MADSQKPQIGDRVVAMRNATTDTCFIYGYGIYKENIPDPNIAKLLENVPPEMVENMEKILMEMGHSEEELHTAPVILLDSGETLLGSQCHWGAVEKFDSWLQGRVVEVVPMPTPLEQEQDHD